MSSISFIIPSSKSSEYVTIIIKSKEDLIDPYEENIEGKYRRKIYCGLWENIILYL
jgi:hypothetical protein